MKNIIKLDVTNNLIIDKIINQALVVGQDKFYRFKFEFYEDNNLTYDDDWRVTVVFERPDGVKTNNLLLLRKNNYYTKTLTAWISDVEGVLKATLAIKNTNNEIIQTFPLIEIQVNEGVTPGNDTILETQYDGIINDINDLNIDLETHKNAVNPHNITAELLNVYDKTQVYNKNESDNKYLWRDGTKKMGGNLDMNYFNINNAGAVKIDELIAFLENYIKVSNDLKMQSNKILELGKGTKGTDNAANMQNVADGVDEAKNYTVDNFVKQIITIAGIDLKDNISSTELTNALDVATESLKGLMSAQDKINLNTLVALLGDGNGDNDDIINTIREVLEAFNDFPEGADLVSQFAGKVDKVENHSLISNDDLIKLSGIESGAQANVKADWEENDVSADGYIKNKPDISRAVGLTGVLEIKVEHWNNNEAKFILGGVYSTDAVIFSPLTYSDKIIGENARLFVTSAGDRIIFMAQNEPMSDISLKYYIGRGV